MKNLENIRINNLRLANLAKDNSAAIEENTPAIVWLSYNIHGNETSSSEAAMLTLFALVDASNTKTKEWLKNTVVIIDPCLNPDKENQVAGFVGASLQPKLKDGLLFGLLPLGIGCISFLADDVMFRNFWENGKLLLCNAVFLSLKQHTMFKYLFLIVFLSTCFFACKSKSAYNYSQNLVAQEKSLSLIVNPADEKIGQYVAAAKFDSVAIAGADIESQIQKKIDEINAMPLRKAKEVDNFKARCCVILLL